MTMMQADDPFTYHMDEELGFMVHDGCGGPIMSSRWQIYCLRCRPDLFQVDRWALGWLRDNGLLDVLIDGEEAT